MTEAKILPDVAKEKLSEPKPLIVGVKDVPVHRFYHDMDVWAKESAFVKISDERGIHASRLVKVLLKYSGTAIDLSGAERQIVKELKVTHNSEVSYKCKFSLIEQNHVITHTIEYSGNIFYMTVELPYVSVCPCAAALCKEAKQGIAHQQRSIMKVTTIWGFDIIPWLKDLFLMPKEIMSREEELKWCISAVEEKNLVFTEDAARRIGDVLEQHYIDEYLVQVEHFESLHEHSMVAVNRKGRFV
jgi:GTP cyclohydrolase FolE2